MSEAVSGSPAAPTNGTSAATKPAPGISTPTPAPKSGEGAVATPPKAGETKPSWQAIKLKLPVRDGEPEEFELDSEEKAVRVAIQAKQFDRANKELLKERRERQAEAERIKALGFDPANPDAYFQKRLQEELRREQMTEEQRAIDDAKREAATAKQRAEAILAEHKKLLAEQQDARAWQELEPRLQKAMQSHGMLGDSYAMETIEHVAKEFLDAGMDVPPEQVVAEAAARDKERFDARLVKLEPKVLWARLPPEMRKSILAIGVEEWKASKSVSATPIPKQQTHTRTPAPKVYKTPGEWHDKLK